MLNLDACQSLLAKLPIQDRQTGVMVPFVPNFNQWLFKERVKAHQARIGGKIRVVSVKARRVGVSSISDAWGMCHIAERENANGWIVACLSETSSELFRVPTDLALNWPWPLPKPLTTKITYPHKGGDSFLTIATAKSVISGRGPTLSFLHLSEAAYYPSGASFMSLLPSVSDDPGTAIIIESTASGKTGPGETFWKYWDAASRGDSEYLAVFLTWLDDPYCRREPEGLSFNVTDSDERDIIGLVACADRCERCEKCWKALQCIAWRRWALINISQGKVEDFRREYPITADEAFYASSNPAFTPDEKRKVRASIKEPIAIGRIEIDTDSYGQTGSGKPRFVADERAQLYIWDWPRPDYHYYLGVDAARGGGLSRNPMAAKEKIKSDYSSIIGFCGQTGEQVLRYSSQRTDPESLAKIVWLCALYYNNAMVNIELTGNLGLWAQKVLRDTHKYRNLYRWKGRDDKTPGPRTIGSIGWETTVRTRDMMLAAFRSGIHHGSCTVRDSALLTQMDAAEMFDGRWWVDPEIHDDLMVAAMIAWVAKAQWHTGSLVAASKQTLGEEVSGQANPVDEAKREVANARGDVDMQVQTHWRKMLRTINAGGRGLIHVPEGQGVRGDNRLEGI